jgi:putative acyl-CoA dehydrogenase
MAMRTSQPQDDVFNQSPPFEDLNLYLSDASLRRAVAREGGGGEEAPLVSFGAWTGSAKAQELGRLANEWVPVLKTHDAKGRRLDRVEFHPAYHAVMEASTQAGVHALGDEPCPHVTRAARLYLAIQMEAGHVCPLTMTNAAVPVLSRLDGAGAAWIAKARTLSYDPRHLPMQDKTAVTLGMGMTEKQGGTDVRANITRASPVSSRGAGCGYTIDGHKWFMSAPMSDAFLILAQAPGGLTCFLMPRVLEDGRANALHFQRLKVKLGNRSNASSEVEFEGAHATAIGDEGEGTKVIIDMVTETRLDCAVASAGLMRHALAQAVHHAQHRRVFQKALIDQPLMAHVLADMALDVEAAVALSFRLARTFDGSADLDVAWKRIMTPVVKYWTCKTAPALAAEAMECLGGNGYVEELPLARLFREVPVNSIWEGSGNVMALDVVRALRRESDAAALVIADLAARAKADARLTAAARSLQSLMADAGRHEPNARALTEDLAVLAAAILLCETAPAAIAQAFIAARLTETRRAFYGSRVPVADCAAILSFAAPHTEVR